VSIYPDISSSGLPGRCAIRRLPYQHKRVVYNTLRFSTLLVTPI
jgi:hypothetical protein